MKLTMSSIENLKNFYKTSYQKYKKDYTKNDILKGNYTVKLDGTNASLRYDVKNNKFIPQGKNRKVTIVKDNYNFAKWFYKNENDITYFLYQNYINNILNNFEWYKPTQVIIFGEWAGQGIQRRYGISQFPVHFYIFGIELISENNPPFWIENKFISNLPHNFNLKIVNLVQMYNKDIELDMSDYDKLKEYCENILKPILDNDPIVIEMSKIYPDIKIENTKGEGYVVQFQPGSDIYEKFVKIKNDKSVPHKKYKRPELTEEEQKELNKLIDELLPEWRLEQGIIETMDNDLDIKKLGNFLMWIINDIKKEEMNTLKESNFDYKKIQKAITTVARDWFFEKY